MMDWTVYIIRCRGQSYYTGVAKNLKKRMQDHERGKGAKYTRGRGPFLLCLAVSKLSKSEALKLERQIKRLSPQDKEKMVENGMEYLVGFLEQLSNKE